MADKLGLTKTNLDKLATAADVKKTVTADTAQADANLHSITRQLEQIDATTATATVTVMYERTGPSLEAIAGLADGSLGFKGFAGGGSLRGPGTKTSDSFIIRASDGEFMQPARAVDYYGPQFMEDIRHLPLPKFADGGPMVARRFADRSLVSSAMSTVNNSGGNVTNDRRINIEKVVAADFASFEREADRRRRLDQLGSRRAR
jgi:hypothetical protein